MSIAAHRCHDISDSVWGLSEPRLPGRAGSWLLYPGLLNAQEKWTMPIHNWNLTLSQLSIYFEGGLDHVITL